MPATYIDVLFPKEAAAKAVPWKWTGIGRLRGGDMVGMAVLADDTLVAWDVALGAYVPIGKKDAADFASVHGGPPVPEELR